MLRRLSDERIAARPSESVAWGGFELDPRERNLIKKIVSLPEEVAEAVERRGPHRIAGYALELARDFTAFYEHCRVVGADARGGRVVPDRALGRDAADDRAVARPARGERPRLDVGRASAAERREVFVEPLGVGGAGSGARRAPGSLAVAARVRRRQRGRVNARIPTPNSTSAGGSTYTVRLNPCAGGLPSTAGPYWATSWRSIWAFVRPCAIRPRMKLRSASACGDCATASGSRQEGHITSFSMSVRLTLSRGRAAAAVSAGPRAPSASTAASVVATRLTRTPGGAGRRSAAASCRPAGTAAPRRSGPGG